MRKNVFVLCIIFIIATFTGSVLYAAYVEYYSTIPAWKQNVTMYGGTKVNQGNSASNYIYMGEIDPDVNVWFDVQRSDSTWLTVTDVITQDEGTYHTFTLFNSYGSGTTMRLRGRATGWGPTTYEIHGKADIH